MRRKKPKPLKPGEYEPLPFCAVLSPEGKFYRAENWKHQEVAEAVTGEFWEEQLIRKGWLRITDTVHFAFIWGPPTQAQTDALFDYAMFMGWSLIQVFSTEARAPARKHYGMFDRSKFLMGF